MEKEPFVANPHALIVNGVCTEVVYMQDYGPEEIAETLKKHTYDEVVRWDDYGHPIFIGFHKWEDKYVYHKPYPSWVHNAENNDWEAPVPPPTDSSTDFAWHENTQTWEQCELCSKNTDI